VLAGTLLVLAGWYALFLAYGPRLAANHDELNFIYGGLRLPAEGRLDGYVHGPLFFEVVAAVELAWYALARAAGRVASPEGFLVQLLSDEHAHLLACRTVVAIVALLLVWQTYRLAADLAGPWAGAFASLFCASNLTFLSLTSLCKEDALFWLSWVVATRLAWHAASQGGARAAGMAGMAMGAAAAAKSLGVFTFVLAALPLARATSASRGAAVRQSALMAGAGMAAFLVFYPFILTDTAAVFESQRTVQAWLALAGPRLSLGTYLVSHLPNVVGWSVLAAAIVECLLRLRREPRGPVLLLVAPLCLLVFLGLRRGFSLAHYIFPLGLMLAVMAAALAARLMSQARPAWRWLPLLAVGLVVAFDPAFLRGSLKHALVLTAPDTRLQALDTLMPHVPPGDCLVVTEAISGENFFGPPLYPVDPPEVRGAFTRARRQAWTVRDGPRYRLRLVHGSRPDPSALDGCDWVLMPRFGHSPEFGDTPASTEAPAGFRAVAIQAAQPGDRSYVFPSPTMLEYDRLRRVSLGRLWRERTMGWTLTLYRRSPA
jgi:hypothetical protein